MSALTEIERARRDLLTALVVDFHRNTGVDNASSTIGFLMQRYNIAGSRALVEGCLGQWENLGWISVGRSIANFDPVEGPSARIKVAHYADTLEQLLDMLNGNQFEVSWAFGRILTDATEIDGLAIPTGWMIATFESASEKPRDRGFTAKISAPVIHNNVTVSPTITATVSNGDSGSGSSSRATWFGAWGTWVAVIVAIAALVWTLHQAKVF